MIRMVMRFVLRLVRVSVERVRVMSDGVLLIIACMGLLSATVCFVLVAQWVCISVYLFMQQMLIIL